MTPTEIVLIDLSSIAHPIWHMSQSEPDPNHTSQQIVARIRALASDKPHVAICCDSGRSFRHDVSPAYKANRPEAEAPLHHQIALARETLAADGFPIWSVKGFEADDLIATAVTMARAKGHEALIVSADKDLLQLVGGPVKAKSVKTGDLVDEAAVVAKFGVRPDQMRDYLTLVGDKSDNVAGAKGIGEKRAADLLAKFDTLDNIYTVLDANEGKPTAGISTSIEMALKEFRASLDVTRQLITMRSDVEIPYEQVLAERVVSIANFDAVEDDMSADDSTPADAPVEAALEGAVTPEGAAPRLPTVDAATSGPNVGRLGPTSLAVVPDVVDAVPVQYERQLDPRSLSDARKLATDMYQSRLFSAYGTPQGVLSTVMLGRELGLPAMASLRGVHIIEGKHALAAHTMVALVLKSGFAEYFEPVSFDDKQATFVTKRIGARSEVTLTHTIDMAKTAGLVKPNSNWEKVPTDMLMARAQSRLCRLVYPDVVGGLYTPDELKDSANNSSKVA